MISNFSEKTVNNLEDEIITKFCKYINKQKGKNEELEELAENLAQEFVYNVITLNDEQIRIESLKNKENSHTIDSALRLDEVYKKFKEIKNYAKEQNGRYSDSDKIADVLINEMKHRTMEGSIIIKGGDFYNLISNEKSVSKLAKNLPALYKEYIKNKKDKI